MGKKASVPIVLLLLPPFLIDTVDNLPKICPDLKLLLPNRYKHRQEFAADMRLIFNNCETFNEDDSDVGQAGFIMRQFFERRWLELFPDDAP